MTQAYYTAQFAMSKDVKPLPYYLKELRKAYGYFVADTKPVDMKASRELERLVELAQKKQ